MKYRGLVFGFDGVIVNSEKFWAVIEGEYLRNHLPGWTSQSYTSLIGKSLPDAHALLKEKHSFSLSFETYARDYEKMAKEVYSEICKLTPGLNTLLSALSMRRVKIAIASSSKPAWIKAALRHNGIEEYFNAISSATDPDIKNGKPAPDVYHKAAWMLDKDLSGLIAIEDSSNGVSSAKNAGFFCIGFRDGKDSDRDLTHADVIINGFSAENIKLLMGYLI